MKPLCEPLKNMLLSYLVLGFYGTTYDSLIPHPRNPTTYSIKELKKLPKPNKYL
jgi:hypothetical protein